LSPRYITSGEYTRHSRVLLAIASTHLVTSTRFLPLVTSPSGTTSVNEYSNTTIYVRFLARRSVRRWLWPYNERGVLKLRMVSRSRSDHSASPPPSSLTGVETVAAQSTVTTSLHPSDSASQVKAKRRKKLRKAYDEEDITDPDLSADENELRRFFVFILFPN
jgi:hypothetical protein